MKSAHVESGLFPDVSYLLTHEGDGVVDAAVDYLSSSSHRDTQRCIVPHAASDPLPRLQHHHL